MEPLKEGGQSPTKSSLKLMIEGKHYETFQQYMTGAQLKELAGIPLATELFLSIARPYKDELIENEKSVNLARPEIENFFVKKKLHFSIDGKPFTWYKQFIQGFQIRELGNIPPELDIYLDIKEGWEDDLITDDEVVDLARPGKEKFITKPVPVKFTVIIDRQNFTVKQECMTGKEILILAGKTPPERFQLNQRYRGGKVVKIAYDQTVCFTEPGIEKFMTIPLDQTEG